MSFYTGKDINGKSILHLTNGITPINSMKQGPLASTQFHSDLPYIEIEEYECISNVAVDELWCFEPEVAFINALGDAGYFIAIDNKVFRGYCRVDYGWISSTTNGIYKAKIDNYKARPDNTYKYCMVFRADVEDIVGKVTSTDNNRIKFYIMPNISGNGYSPYIKTSNDIFIDQDEFIVRGKDMYEPAYIQGDILNTVDPILEVNSGGDKRIQLTNMKATGPMGISSGPGESAITRGGHTIFSSLYTAKSKYKNYPPETDYYFLATGSIDLEGFGSSSDTDSFYYSGTIEMPAPHNDFTEGELFTVVSSDTNWDPPLDFDTNVLNVSGLYQYRNGDMGILRSDRYTYSYDGKIIWTRNDVTRLRGDNNGKLYADWVFNWTALCVPHMTNSFHRSYSLYGKYRIMRFY